MWWAAIFIWGVNCVPHSQLRPQAHDKLIGVDEAHGTPYRTLPVAGHSERGSDRLQIFKTTEVKSMNVKDPLHKGNLLWCHAGG